MREYPLSKLDYGNIVEVIELTATNGIEKHNFVEVNKKQLG